MSAISRLPPLGLIVLAFPPAAPAEAEVGQKAPPIEAKSLDNTSLRSLDALRGKVVLYEFFAFW